MLRYDVVSWNPQEEEPTELVESFTERWMAVLAQEVQIRNGRDTDFKQYIVLTPQSRQML